MLHLVLKQYIELQTQKVMYQKFKLHLKKHKLLDLKFKFLILLLTLVLTSCKTDKKEVVIFEAETGVSYNLNVNGSFENGMLYKVVQKGHVIIFHTNNLESPINMISVYNDYELNLSNKKNNEDSFYRIN